MMLTAAAISGTDAALTDRLSKQGADAEKRVRSLPNQPQVLKICDEVLARYANR
jgi:hypothetical protein